MISVPLLCSIALSFNRYMVECKFVINSTAYDDVTVLIDTWWNVNAVVSVTVTPSSAVLIDTWWNVN